MRKPVLFLIIILLGATGWIFFKNVDVQNLGTSNPSVEPNTGEIASSSETPDGENMFDGWASSVLEMFASDEGQDAANTAHSNDADRVIRLATFNVNALNETKARKPETMDILSRIGRGFDVLAIQEIHSEVDDIVPRESRRNNVPFQSNYLMSRTHNRFLRNYTPEVLYLDHN